MAKTVTQLVVFISGTSETESEREALKQVVDKLNHTLEKAKGIRLKAITWPDDFRPGVASDPQMVVSQQIGSEYDIYVGLLGARFGTATPRSGSGTEEEFKNALEIFKEDTTKIRLLFYFKRVVQDLFSIDIKQLEKVKAFRERLPSFGVLSRDFDKTTKFLEIVERNLQDLILDEWKEDRWSEIEIQKKENDSDGRDEVGKDTIISDLQPRLSEEQKEIIDEIGNGIDVGSKTADDEDDIGYLDYMEEFYTSTASFNETIQDIANHTLQIGERMTARTAEVEELVSKQKVKAQVGGSRTEQNYVANAKKIINGAAVDLDEFVKAMITSVEKFRKETETMFESISMTLSMQSEFYDKREEKKEDNLTAVRSMSDILISTRESVMGFQDILSSTPAMTGKYKKAQKKATRILGELIAVMTFSIDECQSIIQKLEDIEKQNGSNGVGPS